MKTNAHCRECLLRKRLDNYPADAAKDQVWKYQMAVGEIVGGSGDASSPEIASRISAVYRTIFGPEKDYTEIKRYYNELMMNNWDQMEQQVLEAEDPLERAVQLSMTGNMIDFAAMDHVDENQLKALLQKADAHRVDPDVLAALHEEIVHAEKMTVLTDNCGEIVTDRLLICTVKRINPNLEVTVIVRGEPVVNDATMEDAQQTGMEKVASKVIGSGSGIAGTVIGALSSEAAEAVRQADFLLSKGQGNFESLSGCGLNVYYILMCKCSFFMERFGVDQLTGVLTREIRRE